MHPANYDPTAKLVESFTPEMLRQISESLAPHDVSDEMVQRVTHDQFASCAAVKAAQLCGAKPAQLGCAATCADYHPTNRTSNEVTPSKGLFKPRSPPAATRCISALL